jgi:hypothetical protein
MDNRIFGYYVFGGALIGSLFGAIWTGTGNTLAGLGGGAFLGAAIGWFAAAAVMERQKEKKQGKRE